ncbi:uncharacterized protein pirk [Fopius arisanus]|uniref:Pcn protein n=1 Tax=Fopius arisanus TaxID=64838 RepID=A0A0C9RLE3_9HYME|nr:PREDICTED: uncharacterized protein LOC105269950 [Fopius arisanus]
MSKAVMRGDNLRLFLRSNTETLEVLGDGCRVKIVDNTGKIRMIGDGSRLEITGTNCGEIEYRGDGGRIILGPQVSRRNILYIGDGGRVGRHPLVHSGPDIVEKSSGIGFCTTSKIKTTVYTPD